MTGILIDTEKSQAIVKVADNDELSIKKLIGSNWYSAPVVEIGDRAYRLIHNPYAERDDRDAQVSASNVRCTQRMMGDLFICKEDEGKFVSLSGNDIAYLEHYIRYVFDPIADREICFVKFN